jgi:hypothetical protein
VNILSIYAPTLCSTKEEKDEFYEEFEVIKDPYQFRSNLETEWNMDVYWL